MSLSKLTDIYIYVATYECIIPMCLLSDWLIIQIATKMSQGSLYCGSGQVTSLDPRLAKLIFFYHNTAIYCLIYTNTAYFHSLHKCTTVSWKQPVSSQVVGQDLTVRQSQAWPVPYVWTPRDSMWSALPRLARLDWTYILSCVTKTFDECSLIFFP